MHSIHNNVITEFDTRIYDDLEHRNLYVLDMDCNYSLDFLRKVDLNRMFVAPMRWLLLQDQRTLNDNDDNATHNLTFTYDNSITEIFEDLAVYPDSDVVFAKRLNGDFVQLTSVYRPSPQREVIWEDRGNWTVENGLRMKTFDVASARRRNLQQTTLKTTVVLTNLKSVNYLDNYEDPQKDPTGRANFNWVRHIVNRMNATLNVTVENSTHWGNVFKNGTSNGLVGMLIRREIDISGIHMPFLHDRLDKVKYINLHTNLGMKFIFRQPLLSSVKNIFILPFERNVWIAIAVFLLVVFCFLYISMKWEYYRNTMKQSAATWKDTHIGNPTLGEDFLILLGACAQQGYSYEPYRFSTRIITLMLLVASLSLYTAYTANIVALLQSPGNSIKTVSDLLHSHLILGAQDYIFVHYLFKSYQDPVRKAILEEKIEPKGHKANWMDVVDATPRIRNESFAFHGSETRIYQIIEETFQEYEKCGITEIDYLNEVAYLVVPKQSPYLEIIKNGAMKLREYGLKFRDEYRLFTRKPKCTNPANFISVGFTECRFVILVMSYGFLITLIVFALELVWHKIRNKFTQKETVLIVKKNEDLEITEYIDVDLNRMFVAPMRWLLLQDQRTLNDNDDNANLTFTYDNSISEIFEDLAVYPDSDIVFAKRLDGDFVQLTSVYRPSPQRGVIWEDRGNWTVQNGLRMKTFDVASTRRRNLQQTTLKTTVVLGNPKSVSYLDNYEDSQKDPAGRANFNWVRHIVNRINATLNVTVAYHWGQVFKNGTSSGLVGMLIRREIDISGTPMFILNDRVDKVKYINLRTNIGAKFIFRQPLLSSVKNIFILPFERNVWIAIAVFLLVVFCLLYLSMKWEYYRNTMKKSSTTWKDTHIGNPTLGEDFLVLLGACTQQGYSYEPYRFSTRIITLTLLVASLSLYTAYTANIVALLQSPGNSIKTVSDLLHSHLILGAQNYTATHNLFKHYQDPVRKAIFEEKIEPKRHKANWMDVVDATPRIRNESFAFYGSESRIYQIIEKIFQEYEKCGITEIDYTNEVLPHLALPKQSSYLEIIKNGAMILREYGLKFRDEYRLITRKPQCSNQANFLSVGFTECRFLIIVMVYGFLITLIVFALELVWHKM
ncbi:uncharacterized protein LOC114941095 [Nylanderia fulva]|uniref:uncharacterized protein LOC114941095 n=1 Tax=Nylanderia fulva TaxID=613905 RepID=UPI0010FAE00F|nr:uncharacterized protein LOC114941095 [Nylanderia fulva]